MVIDINQTYCSDSILRYTNIESLCCTTEIAIMLYVDYTSIKKKEGENMGLKSVKSHQVNVHISPQLKDIF